jgi:hypothetical protein
MKFVLLVVAAAGAGALATFAVPTLLFSAASDQLRQIRLTDLSPFRAIYDMEKQQIQPGLTPEQLGIHRSPITISPITLPPPQSLKLDLSHAFEAQAELQIQQNERRMRDMQAYGRDPMHWEGPPPN